MSGVGSEKSSHAGRQIEVRHIYLTGLVVVAALWIALPFVTPVVWGALLSIAEWPLYRRACTRFPGHPMLLAAGFALLTGLVVVIPLSMTAVGVMEESEIVLDWLRHAQQSGIPAPSWIAGLPLIGGRLANWWRQNLASPQSADVLSRNIDVEWLLSWARTVGGTVVQSIGSFLFALVFLGSLLARGHEIGRWTRTVANRMDGVFGTIFAQRMVEAVRSTVNGTLLVSFGEGSAIGVGYLVAGVPMPLLFAVATIALAPISFAAWVIFGIASLILVGMDHTLSGALLFVFGAAVMQIGDNVVAVAVVGRADKLPFLMYIVGAVGGVTVLGLIGMFIGPVIMTALLLVWQEWMNSIDAEQSPRTRC